MREWIERSMELEPIEVLVKGYGRGRGVEIGWGGIKTLIKENTAGVIYIKKFSIGIPSKGETPRGGKEYQKKNRLKGRKR